jgi:hypothetical protein
MHLVKYSVNSGGEWTYPAVDHDRLLFHLENSKDSSGMLCQAEIFMRHYQEEADISMDELRALAQDPVRSRELMAKMSRYARNIRGTDGYFRARREELEHAVQQRGPLHVFLTFTQAEYPGEDLHRLITVYAENGDRHKERCASVRRNPNLVNA